MLVVRAARSADHEAFIKLARAAGPGFTSMALEDDALNAKLVNSEKAFDGKLSDPGDCAYQLMLEDSETGEVLGTSAIKAMVGVKKPYFDFKIFTFAQSSKEADRRFDMDAMMLVNDFAGSTEVGSLFVRDGLRGTGAGSLVAKSRYMLVASARERFGSRILSELRGVVDDKGDSIFFEHVTRPFFHMSFEEADRLSAATDNQFILDLMPQHLIYVDLLPRAAREVIGMTHPHGVNALRMLEAEGLRYERYVDIFDAGPLVSCGMDEVATIRDSRMLTLGADGPAGDGQRMLVSNDRNQDFRCVYTQAQATGDALHLNDEARRALDVTQGEPVRIWTRD